MAGMSLLQSILLNDEESESGTGFYVNMKSPRQEVPKKKPVQGCFISISHCHREVPGE